MASNIEVRHVLPDDLPQISALHALVFGPGRFTRTAYRIREGTPDISPFCLKAVDDTGALIAVIRFTPVTVGGKAGALLLGPLAVEPVWAGKGFGRRLIADGMALAKDAGVELVVLVGDAPYYERFGFVRSAPDTIKLPGPVDPARLLIAELVPGAGTAFRGMVAGIREPMALSQATSRMPVAAK